MICDADSDAANDDALDWYIQTASADSCNVGCVGGCKIFRGTSPKLAHIKNPKGKTPHFSILGKEVLKPHANIK